MSNNFYISDFIRKLMDNVYAVSPEANNIFIVNGRGERISLASELGSALSDFKSWSSFSPDPYIGVVLRAKSAILKARAMLDYNNPYRKNILVLKFQSVSLQRF